MHCLVGTYASSQPAILQGCGGLFGFGATRANDAWTHFDHLPMHSRERLHKVTEMGTLCHMAATLEGRVCMQHVYNDSSGSDPDAKELGCTASVVSPHSPPRRKGKEKVWEWIEVTPSLPRSLLAWVETHVVR